MTCTRPQTHCEGCPRWEQPSRLELASYFLRLYKRVKVYGSLPRPGGLQDQDELTMRILDRIDAMLHPKKAVSGDQS